LTANAMWAIRESSAVRIGARRRAGLVLFKETCRSGNGSGKVGGKARRERQSERAERSWLVGRSEESRGRIVPIPIPF